jgi:hypothetical protein
MEWLIATDHPTPASECPIVMEEEAFDLAYSMLMAAVISARDRTNDPILLGQERFAPVRIMRIAPHVSTET